MIVVSPQCGMGPYWYKNNAWIKSKLNYYSSMCEKDAGSWPPLIAKRDRNDPLQYKGRTLAPTIWTI